MPLWGNQDTANGYQKPLFANTTNVWSSSTINGSAANTNAYYGNVFGVSANEMNNNAVHGPHGGWQSQKVGTGPVTRIDIVNGGTGINAAGYLLITDSSVLAQGAGFNASFTIANSQNTLQSFSSNSTLNTINSITINNGGSGFSAVSSLNVRTNGSNTLWPSLSITLGGRAGRLNYETLVAMGSITGDDPRDNVYFTGV
jgi:hypothetical protein